MSQDDKLCPDLVRGFVGEVQAEIDRRVLAREQPVEPSVEGGEKPVGEPHEGKIAEPKPKPKPGFQDAMIL